jgi:hypothetical protein
LGTRVTSYPELKNIPQIVATMQITAKYNIWFIKEKETEAIKSVAF